MSQLSTESRPPSSPPRRTLLKGAAWTAPVAMFSVAAPAMALSVQCDTLFDAQSRGRLLSGTILGADLDAVVELEGAHAEAFAPVDHDLDQGAVSVEVLQAIELELGDLAGLITSLMATLANQDAGLANQFAVADAEAGTGDGSIEVGASGAVNDATGAIDLSYGDEGPPELARIDLRSLLQQMTGGDGVADLVEAVASLELEIGALAAVARLDGVCEDVGGVQQLVDVPSREHLLTSLRLAAGVGLAEDLLSDLDSVTVDTSGIVAGVPGVLESVLGDAGGAIGQLLNALLSGTVAATVELDVEALAGESIPGDGAAVQIDLDEGIVVVDLAPVLGGAYEDGVTDFFNQLPPNSRLFTDAYAPIVEVGELVGALTRDVLTRIQETIEVEVSVTAPLGLTRLTVSGTLAEMLAGEGVVEAQLAGAPISLGDDGPAVLVAVGDLVQTAVDAAFGTEDGGLVADALSGLNGVLDLLFTVLSGVVAITINAQNNTEEGIMPAYYAALGPERRFDVAALHVALLEAADPALPSGLLNLSLGRGSVGQNEPRSAG